MNIFITGVTGYLGQALAAFLGGLGHTVTGSSRRQFELGQPPNPEMFTGIDVVVHAAYAFHRGAMYNNVEGTRACFVAAKKCGARRQVFLSSYSARADSKSEYGQTKYQIERTFLDAGEIVLRPGLVVGHSGVFARQRAALLRTPVVPIIGNGNWPTAVIGLKHFLEATGVVIARGEPGEYGLFYEAMPSMREFVTAVKTHAGQRFVFLPLSASLAQALVRMARVMGLNVPADPDQIASLQHNQTAPWHSDLPALLPGREAEFFLDYALTQNLD